MDHYKILGVTKNASKDEIKKAFRKLAMQFHPDKHSQSSKNLKDAATLKFKLLSEAYDTLIDDQKRADYNIKSTTTSSSTYHQQRYSSRYYNSNNNGGSSSSSYYGNYGYGYGGSSSSARSGGGSQSVYTRFEMGVKYLTTRAFLLNATFVGVLIGGTYIVDAGGRALWQMHNPGKSFEEAMESVEKAKAFKDDSR